MNTGQDRPRTAAHFKNVEFDDCTFQECSFRGVKVVNCDVSGTTVQGIPLSDLLKAYRDSMATWAPERPLLNRANRSVEATAAPEEDRGQRHRGEVVRACQRFAGGCGKGILHHVFRLRLVHQRRRCYRHVRRTKSRRLGANPKPAGLGSGIRGPRQEGSAGLVRFDRHQAPGAGEPANPDQEGNGCGHDGAGVRVVWH